MLLAAGFTMDGLKVLSFLGSHGEEERMLGPAWYPAPGGTRKLCPHVVKGSFL